MPKVRTLQELRLQPCCRIELRKISDVIQSGRQARIALLAGPWATMLGGNPLEVLFTISATDWGNLTSAVRGMDALVRHNCRIIAFAHSADHPGGSLNQFWSDLADTFA